MLVEVGGELERVVSTLFSCFWLTFENHPPATRWWHTPLIQHSGGRGRLISVFEASLVYRWRSWLAKAIQRNPAFEKQTKTNSTKPKQKIQPTHLRGVDSIPPSERPR